MKISIISGTLPDSGAEAYVIPQYVNGTCHVGVNSCLAHQKCKNYIEFYDILRQGKELPIGAALGYETGLAKVKYLIHSAILPGNHRISVERYRSYLQLATYAAVQEAVRMGATSLAIPMFTLQYDADNTGVAIWGALQYCLDLPLEVIIVVPANKINSFRAGTRKWKNYNPFFVAQYHEELREHLRILGVA